MSNMLLPILPGTLPAEVCYSSEQERLNAYAATMNAVLAGCSFFNFGSSAPAPELQGYPWLRTTDMRWYYFSGKWLSPTNGSAYERRLWSGTTVQLQTYDGGDTNPPGTDSGPMWEVDTAFEGRSPMGPGAISGSDPAKNLALSEDYGEGSHVLSQGELPKHYHPLVVNQDEDPGGGGCEQNYTTIGGGEVDGSLNIYDVTQCSETRDQAKVGSDEAHQNVHPVRGTYIIKRTSRTFYAV